MDLKTACKIFGDKGPVNIPGAQVKADQAWRIIAPLLLEAERSAIFVARGHATGMTQEGRREFDRVWAKVRERLLWL